MDFPNRNCRLGASLWGSPGRRKTMKIDILCGENHENNNIQKNIKKKGARALPRGTLFYPLPTPPRKGLPERPGPAGPPKRGLSTPLKTLLL